jgi:hypothetical protein
MKIAWWQNTRAGLWNTCTGHRLSRLMSSLQLCTAANSQPQAARPARGASYLIVPGEKSNALDNLCHSADSVAAGVGISRCGKPDPPVTGDRSDRVDH